MDLKRFQKIASGFRGKNIVVVGDLMLDVYIWGNASRISQEAPVPVVRAKEVSRNLGGAANVIHNIISLGGKSHLCGVVGNDRAGKEVIDSIIALGSVTDGVIIESDRPTSTKTRIVAHNQQVVRFDRESKRDITPESIEKLLDCVKRNRDSLHAVLVAHEAFPVRLRWINQGLSSVGMIPHFGGGSFHAIGISSVRAGFSVSSLNRRMN